MIALRVRIMAARVRIIALRVRIIALRVLIIGKPVASTARKLKEINQWAIDEILF
jgi:hypothetical protein